MKKSEFKRMSDLIAPLLFRAEHLSAQGKGLSLEDTKRVKMILNEVIGVLLEERTKEEEDQ